MTREDMLSKIIQKFGFENEYTIQFAAMIERAGRIEVEALFAELLTMSIAIDEEDQLAIKVKLCAKNQ